MPEQSHEVDRGAPHVDAARDYDHRLLGKYLDLFSISEAVGPGLVLWHPNGARVRMLVEEFCRHEHLSSGYAFVGSPHIGRANLWQTSGHLDYYREHMYPPMDVEGEDYFVKPVNCPYHIQIYQSRTRSYRDLPMRLVEFGTVYRNEQSGALHGLTRTRGFTQDDAHIFCRPDQVDDEISQALAFSLHILRSFLLADVSAYLSTRPAKYVGHVSDWEKATDALRRALVAHEIPYGVDEGGGAFYGPKIDLKVSDALGRAWQLSTIQFDFNLPERFKLEYVASDGRTQQPYMVHRALLGSIERFLGVLIEHFGGSFPLWLAPVQAVVIPIADRHLPYAQQVAARLEAAGLRVQVDRRAERMQAKVRDAQLQKVPYLLVVGDQEAAGGAVAVRLRTNQTVGVVPVEEVVAVAQQVVAAHQADLWPAHRPVPLL